MDEPRYGERLPARYDHPPMAEDMQRASEQLRSAVTNGQADGFEQAQKKGSAALGYLVFATLPMLIPINIILWQLVVKGFQ